MCVLSVFTFVVTYIHLQEIGQGEVLVSGYGLLDEPLYELPVTRLQGRVP